jgi:hypothetical protein
MASWRSKVRIPDSSHANVYKQLLEATWKVAQISKVPKNATWYCFQRGVYYFFLAEWEYGKERWY